MMLSILAAALLLSGTPGELHAQQADPGAAQQPKNDKIVCRRVENTGWRLGAAKVCKTAKQWAERTRQDQKDQQDWGSISGRMRCYGCGN